MFFLFLGWSKRKCHCKYPQFPADLVTFTEEILNGKLHFFCSVLGRNDLRLTLFFYRSTNSALFTETQFNGFFMCHGNNSLNLNELTNFSPALHFIWKPFIWFPVQIKWLVSIWIATLSWNGLISNYRTYVMRCAIWYHLYNLKNMKNTHRGVLRLVKLQALLNCTNGTKSRKAFHIHFVWVNEEQQHFLLLFELCCKYFLNSLNNRREYESWKFKKMLSRVLRKTEKLIKIRKKYP